MNIYTFNGLTGEYAMTMNFEGETLPENSTNIAPPETGENETAIFNIETNSWSVVKDYRFTHKKADSDLNVYFIEDFGEIESDFYLIENELAKRVEENKDLFKIENEKVVEKTASEKATLKESLFLKDFFNTSLGYIRRKVSMKTGETKDFLSDLLPIITKGVEAGANINIIVYNTPDFTEELTDEYILSLQASAVATATFIQECSNQVLIDFAGA